MRKVSLLLASTALIFLLMAVVLLLPPRLMGEPPAPSILSVTPTRIEGDLVNLRASASFDSPGVPLLVLIDALKAYPHAQRFRVSWSLLIFMNGMSTTILYNRRRHSVAVFSSGGGDVLGSYRDHVLFTHVREAVFTRISAAHKNDTEDMGAWSWFSDLPKYGCRKRDLGSWRRDSGS